MEWSRLLREERRGMRHQVLALAAALLGFPPAMSAGDYFLIEWSDRPRNPEWMGGDPVFQRTLSCWKDGQREICKLTVVTIGREFCPAVLITDGFHTDAGDLKVSRTPTAIDLEFVDLSDTWTIHLKVTSDPPIVEQASGIVVTRPVLPQDRLRSSELVALVKGHEWFSGREFAEVELKCAKIAVVAAKKAAN